MYGVVMDERVLAAIPNVEITCHNDCAVQVNSILLEKMKGGLITIRVNVDHEVDIMIAVEC